MLAATVPGARVGGSAAQDADFITALYGRNLIIIITAIVIATFVLLARARAIGYTGRLVTSGALILCLAFIALGGVPVTDVKILSTGLAAGIIIDATLIRGDRRGARVVERRRERGGLGRTAAAKGPKVPGRVGDTAMPWRTRGQDR